MMYNSALPFFSQPLKPVHIMFAAAVYDATPKLHLNIAKPGMRCTSSLSLRPRHRLSLWLGKFGLAPLGVTW